MEVSITTSKIISEDEKKDEEMRFLRQVQGGTSVGTGGVLGVPGIDLVGGMAVHPWRKVGGRG